MEGKKIILVSCINRNLSVTPFPTREAAWDQMKTELLATDSYVPSWYEKDKDSNGYVSADSTKHEYEITRDYAWYTDNYDEVYNDWRIFEI